MRTMFKKAVAILMATAVVVSGVSVANGTTASAAKKKSKTIKVRVFYAGVQGKNQCSWIAGDGLSANNGKVYAKNVKITQGKKAKVSFNIKNPKKDKVTGTTVFTVDLIDILKTFKKNKVKISGVVVKADGKKVSCKTYQGTFEPKKNPNNYRLSIYNVYGTDGDNSAGKGPIGSKKPTKKIKFKKKISVSFTVLAK